MGFLLENKNSLGRYVIPTSSNGITVYNPFSVIPSGNLDKQFSIDSGGIIEIGNPNNDNYNNIIFNAGINNAFKQLTDNGADYLLTNNDYFVEVISTTYNYVTLPLANNIGGRTYIISNGSTNINLVVRTSGIDNIDGRTQIALKRIHDRIKLQSNGIDNWYVI